MVEFETVSTGNRGVSSGNKLQHRKRQFRNVQRSVSLRGAVAPHNDIQVDYNGVQGPLEMVNLLKCMNKYGEATLLN